MLKSISDSTSMSSLGNHSSLFAFINEANSLLRVKLCLELNYLSVIRSIKKIILTNI